jgi:hypothetical protein
MHCASVGSAKAVFTRLSGLEETLLLFRVYRWLSIENTPRQRGAFQGSKGVMWVLTTRNNNALL